jgi:hypothetical protein
VVAVSASQYISGITLIEDFSDCTEISKISRVNQDKLPGGVNVVYLTPSGQVFDATETLSGGEMGGNLNLVDSNENEISESVELNW